MAKVHWLVAAVGAAIFGIGAYFFGPSQAPPALLWGPLAFVAGYVTAKMF